MSKVPLNKEMSLLSCVRVKGGTGSYGDLTNSTICRPGFGKAIDEF